MSVRANPPFSLFTDSSGVPLVAGRIYIGTANMDPVTNPIAVFSDAALTVSVAQPIRTQAGVPVANGSPINLYVAGNYAITVKDRNNLLVYTLPSAVLAGGDITLASGETLRADSGATVDLRSGSTLRLGDASGAGVAVIVASTTKITGSLVPSAAGTNDLGSSTQPWDTAYADAVVAADVAGTTVAGYVDNPTVGSPTAALALNQQKNIVVAGRIGNAGGVSTNHFNILSATNAGGTSVITLDSPIEDDAVVLCMQNGTGGGFEVVGQVDAGGATITVIQRDGGALLSQIYNILVVGRPRGGVTSPV